jgi:arylsulfatase A-like enzyme
MARYKLTRRRFLETAGLCAAASALPACRKTGIDGRRPNIVLILADDLGYGDLGCYGQKKFSTPFIDSLAAGGMRFTQHYSGSTVCAPSRCSLLTGLHTGHAAVRGNRELQPEGQASMPPGTVTIPLLLKEAGYTSGVFGKWGLGAPGSDSDPSVYFDEFFGYNCQRQAHNYYPDHLWRNRERLRLDGKAYSHDLILEAAMDFIWNCKDRPFFCYMPLTIPHASMHAPEALHGKYRRLFPDFENGIGRYSGPDVHNPVAAFPAMMEHLDNGVGQILGLLKELGLVEDTIVFFLQRQRPACRGRT